MLNLRYRQFVQVSQQASVNAGNLLAKIDLGIVRQGLVEERAQVLGRIQKPIRLIIREV